MHITHIYPRFKEVHGGGEPVVFNLLRELEVLGYKNSLLTYNFPKSMYGELSPGTKLIQLPGFFNQRFKNVLLAGFFDLFANCFLFFFIPKNTDGICFHTEGAVPSLFFYKLFHWKNKVLYFCYQPPRFAYDTSEESSRAGGIVGFLMPFFKMLYRPFDRAAVRKADGILTFSSGYKDWIEKIYDKRDVMVAAPGVQLPSNFRQLTPEIDLQLVDSDCILIFIGKLVTWKHVDRLLHIVSLVKKQKNNVRLMVVGDGPCAMDLQRLAVDLGIQENIIFCGFVAGEEVFSYCVRAHLLVHLERNVSFGLALVEANSVGLPVIALEGGGPNDIITNGDNGFLLKKDERDEDIAEKILEYFSDEKQMKAMAVHSKRIAKEFTWQNFAQLFVNSLEHL